MSIHRGRREKLLKVCSSLGVEDYSWVRNQIARVNTITVLRWRARVGRERELSSAILDGHSSIDNSLSLFLFLWYIKQRRSHRLVCRSQTILKHRIFLFLILCGREKWSGGSTILSLSLFPTTTSNKFLFYSLSYLRTNGSIDVLKGDRHTETLRRARRRASV